MATTSETDIPAELNRIFIETIHVKHLDQNERTDIISWLLAKRNLDHHVNLSKISAMCSDYRYLDLLVLMSHAVKFQCKDSATKFNSLTLSQADFDRAYGDSTEYSKT